MTDAANPILSPVPKPRALRHRYIMLALAVFGLIVIPVLYGVGIIDIETVNKLGRYTTFAIMAVGLDLVWGYVGILSLCQALFFCLGGYVMGMYLAHHGGPEGIIDATGWKIPACLYVVYPYAVGELPGDALVPWFWKPFWSLPLTLALGLFIPGIIAFIIGFFGFRSRVRGVYFAILTQAITVAALNFFSMNDMKLGGTNGLTRFDHIVFATEGIEIAFDPDRLREAGVGQADARQALEGMVKKLETEYLSNLQAQTEKLGFAPAGFVQQDPFKMSGSDGNAIISLHRSVHAWDTHAALNALLIMEDETRKVTLGNVADIGLKGWSLANPNVQLVLYLLSVISLIAVYSLCQFIVKSRLGRVLIAVRDDESMLRFAGYKPYNYKLFAFVLGGMIAGLAGMLFVPQMKILTPFNMDAAKSILVVVWVAVGGRGRLSGAVLGALTVSLLYNYLTTPHGNWWKAEYWQYFLGLLFIGTALYPGGLMRLWDWLVGTPISSVSDE